MEEREREKQKHAKFFLAQYIRPMCANIAINSCEEIFNQHIFVNWKEAGSILWDVDGKHWLSIPDSLSECV